MLTSAQVQAIAIAQSSQARIPTAAQFTQTANLVLAKVTSDVKAAIIADMGQPVYDAMVAAHTSLQALIVAAGGAAVANLP
jgi:hypothetical protein